MLVFGGKTETLDGAALEVDLDEDCRLVAHYPGVVPGRDVDDGGSGEIDAAPVGILEVDRAVSEEADVSVATMLRADKGTEVDRPAQSGRVDHPLDPSVADPDDV